MSTPRVSVILPCYNLGRYLDEAVDSVLAQSFQEFEILVVDDGSTDPATRELLAAYRRPRTRVIGTENRGLPAARNLGLVHTTGRYVCFLDADDKLHREYFEKAVAVLDADPDVAFVSHWVRTFGAVQTDWTPERCDLLALLDMNTVNGAALVRRSALESVGAFDETMRLGCEDWDLWITMVERGFRGVIIPEVLFYYRRRPDSMTEAMRGEPWFGLFRYLIEKHRASYGRHVVDLVMRRERGIGDLLRHTHDLELEYRTSLGPELLRRRDDVRLLRARIEGIERERQRDAEMAELRAQVREARERAEQLNAAWRSATEEAVGLRRSMSWRLTAPLRGVYGRLRALWRES